jgi:hypothetical protein
LFVKLTTTKLPAFVAVFIAGAYASNRYALVPSAVHEIDVPKMLAAPGAAVVVVV